MADSHGNDTAAGADPMRGLKDWAGRLACLLVFSAFMLTVDTAAAQPIMCSEPQVARTDHMEVPAELLVGTHRCVEEGLTITLRLEADGRFECRMKADPGQFSDAERKEFDEAAGQAGRWRVERKTLYLFERPTRAPTIRLVETARDPSVWLRVEVREADGRPARGLFIGEGPDANPRSDLENGLLVIPRTYGWEAGIRQIVRLGDDLQLASFSATTDGPNVFRFVYAPSEVEPFEIRADVMDVAGDAIAVPFGIGAAILRRSAPDR